VTSQISIKNPGHSTPSHERLRAEIELQVEAFLRQGGEIEVVKNQLQAARPIGPVWWDTRGNGMIGALER
jgi:hypothetical protein